MFVTHRETLSHTKIDYIFISGILGDKKMDDELMKTPNSMICKLKLLIEKLGQANQLTNQSKFNISTQSFKPIKKKTWL